MLSTHTAGGKGTKEFIYQTIESLVDCFLGQRIIDWNFQPAANEQNSLEQIQGGVERLQGFPGVSVVRVHLPSKRNTFDPWVGKITWRRKW